MIGVGRALGSRLVTNDDLAERLDTNDDWIVERTGIKQRYFTAEDEDCATLAISAAKQALEHAGIDGETVTSSSAPPRRRPSPCPRWRASSGNPSRAPGVGAFDLAAACTGFPTAPRSPPPCSKPAPPTASSWSGPTLHGDSRPGDRSTAVLFGDGAGAVVLERGDGGSGFVDHILGADGRMAPFGRAGHPGQEDHKLCQNGREVFKFASRIFPELVGKLLARNDVKPDEIQYVIPHQANARIIRAAARKMEVPEDRIVLNVDRFGNTSAASIPLAYPDIFESFEPGKYVVTVGLRLRPDWAANLYRI
jgi:3-oxoacyl-[acyl-carrier-protein] synthase-3